MLTLFKPWQCPCNLLESHLNWSTAFESYQFSDSIVALIDNFTVEMECKDAR
ncbi:hypothetical protein M404DRAFT_70540, partial [Pisolithus tinctorius Marx 270]